MVIIIIYKVNMFMTFRNILVKISNDFIPFNKK